MVFHFVFPLLQFIRWARLGLRNYKRRGELKNGLIPDDFGHSASRIIETRGNVDLVGVTITLPLPKTLIVQQNVSYGTVMR